MEYKKKLIEVALPLESINNACAYEKMPGIGPHPRGIHLWWARRPLAATRAIIWASLVNDPTAYPEKFKTEEEQAIERDRLFHILSELVKWKNSDNKEILDLAKEEIKKSIGENSPTIFDPFAGGGAIPLEAQRLGLEVIASDLNPVAVIINKTMIELTPIFNGQHPINPESNRYMNDSWEGVSGLVEDFCYYAEWMKNKAYDLIGHLYPRIKDYKGVDQNVITWIWTRTVKCPNPACGCEMPLANTFELSKRKGKEAYILPIIKSNQIQYVVKYGKDIPESPKMARGKFKCICCGSPVDSSYIKSEGMSKRIGSQLMAIVAEGKRGRIYISPTDEHIQISKSVEPEWQPQGEMFGKAGDQLPLYGYNSFSDLFTNRQLVSLTTLSDLLPSVIEQIIADGGTQKYAELIGTYLAFTIDRLADFSTAFSRWSVSNEKAMNMFSKQAIPMTWDYPEVNVFANSVGGFTTITQFIAKCIQTLPLGQVGTVKQEDAQSDSGLRNIIVSTDPPYYDNICYADLSDFFYIWLRNNIKNYFPDLFKTLLVPKAEELVASTYRFNGDRYKAHEFFEKGMLKTFKQINSYVRDDIPTTVYYAYKQSENDKEDNVASTGWETMLTAIIQSGFSITGTWPLRSEQSYRAIGMNANALASSIVLVCRKRSNDAPICTRREFINTLKRELKPALAKLQASNIAPVDLAQSAIGPGIGIYSRFSKVVEADGTSMSVRSALQIINQELDMYFSEQDGELDRDSRFCVDLYTQYAFNDVKFGEADVLARAKNTSVDKLVTNNVIYAHKGIVRLLTRDEIPDKVNSKEKNTWTLTQQITKSLEKDGVLGAAKIVANMFTSEPEHAKALAYRLFTIAERKGWAGEAYAYNSLVIAWPEIQSKAAEIRINNKDAEQTSFL